MEINKIDVNSIFTSQYVKSPNNRDPNIPLDVFAEDGEMYPFIDNMDLKNYDNSTDYTNYPKISNVYLIKSVSDQDYENVRVFDINELITNSFHKMETGFRRGSLYNLNEIKIDLPLNECYPLEANSVLIERVNFTGNEKKTAIYRIIDRIAVSDSSTSFILDLDLWGTFNEEMKELIKSLKLVRGHYPMMRYSLEDYLQDPARIVNHFDAIENLGGDIREIIETNESVDDNNYLYYCFTFNCDFYTTYNSIFNDIENGNTGRNIPLSTPTSGNPDFIIIDKVNLGRFYELIYKEEYNVLYKCLLDVRLISDKWFVQSGETNVIEVIRGGGTDNWFIYSDNLTHVFDNTLPYNDKIIRYINIQISELKEMINTKLGVNSGYEWMQKFYTKEHMKIKIDYPNNDTMQEVFFEELIVVDDVVKIPIQIKNDTIGSFHDVNNMWRVVKYNSKGWNNKEDNVFSYPYERLALNNLYLFYGDNINTFYNDLDVIENNFDMENEININNRTNALDMQQNSFENTDLQIDTDFTISTDNNLTNKQNQDNSANSGKEIANVSSGVILDTSGENHSNTSQKNFNNSNLVNLSTFNANTLITNLNTIAGIGEALTAIGSGGGLGTGYNAIVGIASNTASAGAQQDYNNNMSGVTIDNMNDNTAADLTLITNTAAIQSGGVDASSTITLDTSLENNTRSYNTNIGNIDLTKSTSDTINVNTNTVSNNVIERNFNIQQDAILNTFNNSTNTILSNSYDAKRATPIIVKPTNKLTNKMLNFNYSIITSDTGNIRRASEEYRSFGYRCNEYIGSANDDEILPILLNGWSVSRNTYWQFDKCDRFEIDDIPDSLSDKILNIMKKGFTVTNKNIDEASMNLGKNEPYMYGRKL